jgi:hypothetical protein
MPFDATAGEVQGALEGFLVWDWVPTHHVEVTGGPGDETGAKPYVITFTG